MFILSGVEIYIPKFFLSFKSKSLLNSHIASLIHDYFVLGFVFFIAEDINGWTFYKWTSFLSCGVFCSIWKLIALCNNYLDCFGLVGSFWLFMKYKYIFYGFKWLPKKNCWLKAFRQGHCFNLIDLFW